MGNLTKPLEDQPFRNWKEEYMDPPRPSRPWKPLGDPGNTIGKLTYSANPMMNHVAAWQEKDNRLGLMGNY